MFIVGVGEKRCVIKFLGRGHARGGREAGGGKQRMGRG